MEALAALSVSAGICYVGVAAARTWGVPGQAITIITALTVALATLAPRRLAPLVPSAEGLAQILMQAGAGRGCGWCTTGDGGRGRTGRGGGGGIS